MEIKWKQFSLRMFLVLSLGTGVAGGCYMKEKLRVDTKWQALAEIGASGGDMDVTVKGVFNEPHIAQIYFPPDWNGSEDGVSVAGLIALSKFQSLETLDFSFRRITDANVVYLQQLPNLVDLSLKGTQVTNDGLAPISQMNQLRFLNLSFTSVSDSGLKHLTTLDNLEEIHLTGTQVSGVGVAILLSFESLKIVSVNPNVIPESTKQEFLRRGIQVQDN